MRALPIDRQHLILKIVIAQYQLRDLVGHLRQLLVTLFVGQFTISYDRIQKNLDIDFMIRTVNTSRVVDRVGADQTTTQGVFNTRPLREPQVATLGDHFAAQLRAVDSNRIVGAISAIGVRLGAGFDIGAYASVVKKIRLG